MAKLEKRSNPPPSLTIVSTFSPPDMKCGICRKQASKRYYNSWRVIDVCNNQPCMVQGAKWAANNPYSKRQDAPFQTFRKPGEFKYMTRRADPLPKPPTRARAR